SRRRRRPRRIVLRNCLPCPLSPPNRRCAMITRPSPQQKGFSMPRTRFALLSAVALLLSFPAATAFAAGAKAPAPPAKAAVAPPTPGVDLPAGHPHQPAPALQRRVCRRSRSGGSASRSLLSERFGSVGPRRL